MEKYLFTCLIKVVIRGMRMSFLSLSSHTHSSLPNKSCHGDQRYSTWVHRLRTTFLDDLIYEGNENNATGSRALVWSGPEWCHCFSPTRVNKEGRTDEGPSGQCGPEQPGGNKWWHSSIWVKKEGMTLIHFLADGGVWSRNEVIIADDTTVQYRLALRKRHRGGRFIINRVFVCVRLPVAFVFICFYSSLVHVCVSSWNLLPKSLCKNDIYLSCRWQQQVSTQIRSMEINIIITAHTAHIHKENSTHCYENKGFVWNWLLV